MKQDLAEVPPLHSEVSRKQTEAELLPREFARELGQVAVLLAFVYYDFIKQDLAEVPPLHSEVSRKQTEAELLPREFARELGQVAVLLDIDGTLLDLAPTPREVWVPPDLAKTMPRLLPKTSGALALVRGRSVNDIDLIFAPMQFPAVGG